MDNKTNVMRILDQKKVQYKSYTYEAPDGALSGGEISKQLNIPPERVFKTLVTVGKSGRNYVFMIPALYTLNLKRAASAVREKSIEMLKSKELLPLTGYVHGGCSPIGMKKLFTTVVHETAVSFDEIVFSAGRIGAQIELPAQTLAKLIPLTFTDVADLSDDDGE